MNGFDQRLDIVEFVAEWHDKGDHRRDIPVEAEETLRRALFRRTHSQGIFSNTN